MTKLIYIADPMCSWCYGFGPELVALLKGVPELKVTLVVGGLRAYNSKPMDEAAMTDLMSHWRRIHEISGLPFLDHAVMQPGFIYDTEPACRAVVAARSLSASAALPVFTAIQQAFYAKGRDVTRGEILAEIACQALAAVDIAITSSEFHALWASDEIKSATRADFAQTKHWKVDGFPMLVLERNGALDMVTAGYVQMPALIEQLQSLVDASPAS